MEINAVGIMGASETGAALAGLLLRQGLQVRLYDGLNETLNIALAKLTWALRAEGKADLLGNLEGIREMSKFRGADIIIEAAAQSPEEQKVYFGKLKQHLDAGCIIALRSSLRPVGEAIETCGLPPERSLGLHFLKPVRTNALVEVVRTHRTADGLLEATVGLLRRLEKTPVIVRDNPGQIVQRLARPFTLAAQRLLEAGKGRPHEIDSDFMEVSGAAGGPFGFADYYGLDEELASGDYLYAALGSPERLAPAPALRRLVQYGQLGRKSSIGFYLYEDGQIAGENPILPNLVKYLGLRRAPKEEIFAEIMRPVIEEAKLLAAEIMASEYDIETAARLAFGWPKGPFAYGRDLAPLLEKKRVSEFDKLDTF